MERPCLEPWQRAGLASPVIQQLGSRLKAPGQGSCAKQAVGTLTKYILLLLRRHNFKRHQGQILGL